MVDIKQIVDVKTAQDLKYDGQDLTAEQKKLLEDENLREVDGVTPDISKLKKAAELLEVIIKAKKAATFDDELYTKLNEARLEGDVLKAFNKIGIYQNAIDHLISKRGKKDDSSKTKDDIDKLLDDRNMKVSTLDARIRKRESMKDVLAIDQAKTIEKADKAEEDVKKLEDLKTLIEEGTPVTGRPLNHIILTGYTDIDGTTAKTGHINGLLEDIVTKNEASAIHKKKYFNTKVADYFGRGWIHKNALETLMLQFWEVFLEAGKDNFFNKATHLSTTDKNKFKGYWDKWEKVKWRWKEGEKGLIFPTYLEDKDKKVVSKIVTNRPTDVWPRVFFNFEEFREFLESTFGVTGTALPKDFLELVGGKGKDKEFVWLSYSEEPFKGWTKGPYDIKKWLEKDFKRKLSELEAIKKKIDNDRGVIRFIQDSFTHLSSGNFISNTDWVLPAGELSVSEHVRENSMRELVYINELRNKGIKEELISDEELISITQLSRDSYFQKRKAESASYSHSNARDFKTARCVLINKEITTLAVTKVDTVNKAGTWGARVDTTPLAVKIGQKRSEALSLRGNANIISSSGSKIYEDIIILKLQKAELEQEIIELEAEKAKLDKQDPLTVKQEFKDLFGDDTSASIVGKFSRIEIEKLRTKIAAIKAKESPMEKFFIDAEKKLDEIKESLNEFADTMDFWNGLGETTSERLDNCPDKDRLQKYWDAFEGAGQIVKLKDSEKKEQEAIKNRIAGTDSPTTPPQKSDLDEAKLTALFGLTADKSLLDTWSKLVDGKAIKESKLKTIIGDKYAPTKSDHEGLIAHLRDQGDIDNKKDYKSGTDAEKKASWETFIKKGPEKVIKTIVVHENHGDKLDKIDKDNSIIAEMKKDTSAGYDTDPKKNKFNKERYGNPEDLEGSEKPTKEKLIQYLFDKKIENVKQRSETWEKETTPPGKNGDDKTNGNGEKSWWKFGEGNVWRPMVSYGLILVAIIGVAAVIFWEKISSWWSGPAEEEGEIGENKKEEEEGE